MSETSTGMDFPSHSSSKKIQWIKEVYKKCPGPKSTEDTPLSTVLAETSFPAMFIDIVSKAVFAKDFRRIKSPCWIPDSVIEFFSNALMAKNSSPRGRKARLPMLMVIVQGEGMKTSNMVTLAGQLKTVHRLPIVYMNHSLNYYISTEGSAPCQSTFPWL